MVKFCYLNVTAVYVYLSLDLKSLSWSHTNYNYFSQSQKFFIVKIHLRWRHVSALQSHHQALS